MSCARFLVLLCLLSPLALSSCGKDKPNAPQPVPLSGPLVSLSFTGDATDQSGNGNHGSLAGGATAAGALVVGDNATDWLSLPASVMDGLGDFTFAAWLRIDTFRNESHEVISGANNVEDNALAFWYRETTDEWVVAVDNVYSTFAANSTIEDGAWHHLALIRSGTGALLYLDGTQLGGAVTANGAMLDIDAGGLLFGQDQDTVGGGFEADEAWAGAMDNMKIYNRALSPSEVATLATETH